MSLIHEALKKAEQQRRLGQPPTLGSPVAATRRRRSLLPLLLGATVAAAGAAWWLLRTPDGPTAPTPSAATAPPAAAPTDDKPARSTAAARPPTVKSDAPSTDAATGLVSPSAALLRRTTEAKPETPVQAAERELPPRPPGSNPLAAGETPVIQLGERPAEPPENPVAGAVLKVEAKNAAAARSGLPQAPPAAVAAPGPGKPLNAAAANSAMAAAMKPPTRTTATSPAAAASTPASSTAVAAPPPGAPAPATPGATAPAVSAKTTPASAATTAASKPTPDLPLFWQLPYNVRKDLPSFALSMHVFSSDPKSRFVILNGNRQVEGDVLGTDVNLREIRPDGVVLEFHSQRFLVPRVGS